MNIKATAAFTIFLVILLIFAYYTLYYSASKAPPPRVVNSTKPRANQTTNTIKPSNTITNKTITNTTNSSYINCISPNFTVPIKNGNFGTGTYAGWNITGQGFLNSTGVAVPTNIIFANANGAYYNAPWANYNGNYFASTYHGGISINPGNLTSNPFEVREPYLNFRIISPQSSLLYVELLYNGKPYLRNYYNTLNASGGQNPQSTFVNATMPLLSLLCKNISVRVVAGEVGSVTTFHDFIAVGDFVQSKSNLQTPGTVINSTIVGLPS